MSGFATAARGLRCFARGFVLWGVAFAQTPAGAQELAVEPAALHAVISPALKLSTESAAQPFGYAFGAPIEGRLADKWRGLAARLDSDMAEMMLCRADPAGCLSPAAMQFIGLVETGRERDGLSRIGEINRSVNLSLRFLSDIAQHGAIDVWSSPLESLSTGAGDCEDFAILKLAALRAAGVAEDDLRLVILRNNFRQDDHAVAAVRIDGTWRVLDNQRFLMLEDWQLTGYRATFVIDTAGVHAYADPNIALSGGGAEAGAAQQPIETTPAQRNAGMQTVLEARNS